MMTHLHQKQAIQTAIQAFASKPLHDAATALFATLGFTSERTLAIDSVEHFCTQFDPDGLLSHRAHKSEWTSIHLLFQLTDEELSRHTTLFKDTFVKASLLQSYVFFAIELQRLCERPCGGICWAFFHFR